MTTGVTLNKTDDKIKALPILKTRKRGQDDGSG